MRFAKPIDKGAPRRTRRTHENFVTARGKCAAQRLWPAKVAEWASSQKKELSVTHCVAGRLCGHGDVSVLRTSRNRFGFRGRGARQVSLVSGEERNEGKTGRTDDRARPCGEPREGKALIMAGLVCVDGQREDKAGQNFPSEVTIEVRGNRLPYVSRGSQNSKKRWKEFPLSLAGKICMDVGASTGGFTDCMLQQGAVKVYAVDVGHSPARLEAEKRQSRRVSPRRPTYAMRRGRRSRKRCLFLRSTSRLSRFPRFSPRCAPCSERRRKWWPSSSPSSRRGRQTGKHGVVRDAKVHVEVIENVLDYAAAARFVPLGLSYSRYAARRQY